MSEDRDAKLRATARKVCSDINGPDGHDGCYHCRSIFEALRQTEKEARVRFTSIGCDKCNMSACGCYVEAMKVEARAEGERAGREQTMRAVRCSQCGKSPELFEGDYGWDTNGMHYCADHDPAYVWQAGEKAGREAERERIRKFFVSGDEAKGGRCVYVEWRGQYYGEGPILWAVTDDFRGCLNREGKWEYEPQPSSRDEAFIARCRWHSFDDAYAAAIRARGSE